MVLKGKTFSVLIELSYVASYFSFPDACWYARLAFPANLPHSFPHANCSFSNKHLSLIPNRPGHISSWGHGQYLKVLAILDTCLDWIFPSKKENLLSVCLSGSFMPASLAPSRLPLCWFYILFHLHLVIRNFYRYLLHYKPCLLN